MLDLKIGLHHYLAGEDEILQGFHNGSNWDDFVFLPRMLTSQFEYSLSFWSVLVINMHRRQVNKSFVKPTLTHKPLQVTAKGYPSNLTWQGLWGVSNWLLHMNLICSRFSLSLFLSPGNSSNSFLAPLEFFDIVRGRPAFLEHSSNFFLVPFINSSSAHRRSRTLFKFLSLSCVDCAIWCHKLVKRDTNYQFENNIL